MTYRLARFSGNTSVIVYKTPDRRYAPATRKGLFEIRRCVSGLGQCPCAVYTWSTWNDYTRTTRPLSLGERYL